MRRRWGTCAPAALALSLLVVPAGLAAPVLKAPPRWKTKPAPAYSPDSLLVRFRDGLSPAAAAAAITARGGSLGAPVGRTGYRVVRTAGPHARSLLPSLRRDQRVADARLNYIRRAFDIPNDPLYATSQASYLSMIRMPQAWGVTHGVSSVVIAVLDTGVDRAQPDLSPRLVAGYDFVNGDSAAADDFGHGTMVAGVAAAATNNGYGVAGVAWSSSVMPVKVLNQYGMGTDAQVASGITWAADQHASVINLSLGGTGDGTVVCAAVSYALSKDSVVVAAAGNSSDATPEYPAACPGALAVTGTDSAGAFAYFSSFGSWVGLAAPGMAVTSTVWNNGGGDCCATDSGTSFAAPLVSGAAALVRAKNGSWSQSQVVALLEATAHDVGAPGTDPYFGSGVLDAYAALGGAVQPPSNPTGDVHEPNGDSVHATPLPDSARATIAPAGDVDWYSVAVTQPGLVAFTVDAARFDPARARNFDPVLQVFGPDLALLSEEDIGGWGSRESVVGQARSPGRYYLRVANYGGAESPGSYRVSYRRLPFYRVDVLPLSPAGTSALGTDISNTGVVVGGADGHGAIWPVRNRPPQLLPAGTSVVAMNAAGDMLVNWFRTVPATTPCGKERCASLDRHGTLRDLWPIYEARALNGTGAAVGTADGGVSAIWQNGTVTPLFGAFAINDSGQIAGSLPNANNSYDAYLRTNGITTDLGTLGGCGSGALALNNLGVVVGRADVPIFGVPWGCGFDHAAVWDHGQITDLGVPAAASLSQATDVNAAGMVIGDATIPGYGPLAILDVGPVMLYLNDLFPAGQGWIFGDPRAVNDGGEIVTWASRNGVWEGGVVLTPSGTPAPPPPGAPANDSFAGAERLDPYTGGVAIAETSYATREPGEPTILGNPGGHSVWYSWTPINSGTATVDTRDSNFDTTLGVYRGSSLSTLTPVAADDDSGGYHTSRVTFEVRSGRTYWIQVDGHNGPRAWFGSLVLHVTEVASGSPANDDFENPHVVLLDQSSSSDADLRRATKQPGEPDHAGNPGGHSVWFSWTPLIAGTVKFSAGGGFDSLLAVYTGDRVDQLTPVVSNDDISASNTDSQVSLHALAGVTYRIAVDGKNGSQGDGGLTVWSFVPDSFAPNDNFSAASEFTGTYGTGSFYTDAATREPGEPTILGNPGGHSIWFWWKAPSDGLLFADAISSDFDTMFAAYTGSALTGLTPVGANDNYKATTDSRLELRVTTGTTYHFQLDGHKGTTSPAGHGIARTRWEFFPTPANDNFVAAQQISGDFWWTDGDTTAATRQPAEPTINGNPGGRSLWYRWTASTSGVATFDTLHSAFDTTLAAYSGDSLASLVKLAQDDDSAGDGLSRISFPTFRGRTYFIQADGHAGTARPIWYGHLSVQWQLVPGPANDDFAGARALIGTAGTVVGDSTTATREPGEPTILGNPGGHSLWYGWTAAAAGTLTVDTNGSAFDSMLAVYRGVQLTQLTKLAEDDDSGTGPASSLSLPVVPGETFRIQLEGRKGTSAPAWYGKATLRWSFTATVDAGRLSNGSFEGGLGGWVARAAGLSRATDGIVGVAAARVTPVGAPTIFGIFTLPSPVHPPVAGRRYVAAGYVRTSTPGRSVCLTLREWASSTTSIGSSSVCVAATSQWRTFPNVSYTAKSSSSALILDAAESPAGSAPSTFEVDGLSLH